MVIAGIHAANRHAIRSTALRIGDIEIGEDGVVADIVQPKPLFPAKLPP